jgi:hypothetical protein
VIFIQLIAKDQTENFLTRHVAQTSDQLAPKMEKYFYVSSRSLRMYVLRAHSKLTSHFVRRCIPSGCVAKTQEYPDIPAFSRLVGRAPHPPKLRTYFFVNPKVIGSRLPKLQKFWVQRSKKEFNSNPERGTVNL